jgi:hypothetical protein
MIDTTMQRRWILLGALVIALVGGCAKKEAPSETAAEVTDYDVASAPPAPAPTAAEPPVASASGVEVASRPASAEAENKERVISFPMIRPERDYPVASAIERPDPGETDVVASPGELGDNGTADTATPGNASIDTKPTTTDTESKTSSKAVPRAFWTAWFEKPCRLFCNHQEAPQVEPGKTYSLMLSLSAEQISKLSPPVGDDLDKEIGKLTGEMALSIVPIFSDPRIQAAPGAGQSVIVMQVDLDRLKQPLDSKQLELRDQYKQGSVLLSTNRAFKHWPEIFNNDAVLTSALLDRLLHHADICLVEGKSFRAKDQAET